MTQQQVFRLYKTSNMRNGIESPWGTLYDEEDIRIWRRQQEEEEYYRAMQDSLEQAYYEEQEREYYDSMRPPDCEPIN